MHGKQTSNAIPNDIVLAACGFDIYTMSANKSAVNPVVQFLWLQWLTPEYTGAMSSPVAYLIEKETFLKFRHVPSIE